MGRSVATMHPAQNEQKCYCSLLIIALDFKCICVQGGGGNWMALTESAPSLKFTTDVNLP